MLLTLTFLLVGGGKFRISQNLPLISIHYTPDPTPHPHPQFVIFYDKPFPVRFIVDHPPILP